MRIEPARDDDIESVLHLLAENHLPLDGIQDHVATMVVARDQGRVVGSAALEVYSDGALLRSIAVRRRLHGRGIGRELTHAALRLAKDRGTSAIFLLTTTAQDYFPAFGFERIARAEVPAGVQTSVEFTSACPSSAVVMRKRL